MKFSSHIEKQLIDNNLDSIVLTDREGNIEYVNKAAIHLFGYSIEELKGKPISIFEVPGKGVVAEVLAALDREGKWSGEVVRRRKDGSTFHASLSVLTINDEDGKIIGFAGNIKDISQRISITDALIEKQYQLKSIIDNTVDIIASIDKDLNLIEFNQVLTNLVKNSMGHDIKKGDPILNYIDPSKHYILKNLYTRVFTGERLIDIEIFRASTGNLLYFESSYNPIYDENKQIKGISIFSRDITDRVRNEQALKKASEEKDILLSEIHYHIKNNLAIISSVLQLQEININNEEAIKCLKESRMRIKSAALLHEMLYQNNSLDKLGVKEYLHNMFNDINNSIGNQEHKLKISGDEASLLIHNAIPAGLLFNEIFTNSIKHGFKGITHGEIDITIKNQEKLTLFEITENVGGFPDEIAVENSHSTGLLLIKNFTEQLNGSIQLLKKPKTKYILTLDLSC